MYGAWHESNTNCFRLDQHDLRQLQVHAGICGHGSPIVEQFLPKIFVFTRFFLLESVHVKLGCVTQNMGQQKWTRKKEENDGNYLFSQLAFVEIDLGAGLFKWLLQNDDVLLVLFALDEHLLDGAFLLSQDFDGLSMSTLLFFQLKFQVTNTSFQLANDALSTNNGIGFNFLKTNREILNATIANTSFISNVPFSISRLI